MSTLYELQEECEKINQEIHDLHRNRSMLIDTYQRELIALVLNSNMLSTVKWKVGNCGKTVIRIVSNGKVSIDFSPFEFVRFHRIQLLNDVIIYTYDDNDNQMNVGIEFAYLETAINFIERYNLIVSNFCELIELHKLNTRICELEKVIYEQS